MEKPSDGKTPEQRVAGLINGLEKAMTCPYQKDVGQDCYRGREFCQDCMTAIVIFHHKEAE